MEFSMSTVSLVHMSRKSIHISIPTPCHESWDGMDMTERGAFCHSCQKEVIDFSAMTDREVIDYLAMHQTGCGRFRKDQLDTKLSIAEVNNGVFKWRALFLSFLSFVSIKSLVAQPSSKLSTNQISAIQNQNSNPISGSDTTVNIRGKIIDENSQGIVGASVVLLDSLGKSLGIGVATNIDGDFSIDFKKNTSSRFITSYIGYTSTVTMITSEPNQSFIIMLKTQTPDMMKVIPIKTMGIVNVYESPKDTLRH